MPSHRISGPTGSRSADERMGRVLLALRGVQATERLATVRDLAGVRRELVPVRSSVHHMRALHRRGAAAPAGKQRRRATVVPPTTVRARAVDAAAMGDALAQIEAALADLDAWLDAGAAVRQSLADAIAAAATLILPEATEEPRGHDGHARHARRRQRWRVGGYRG